MMPLVQCQHSQQLTLKNRKSKNMEKQTGFQNSSDTLTTLQIYKNDSYTRHDFKMSTSPKRSKIFSSLCGGVVSLKTMYVISA